VADGSKKSIRWEIQNVSRVEHRIAAVDWNAVIESVAREVYNWDNQLPVLLPTSLIKTSTLKNGVRHDDSEQSEINDARKAS